MKRSEALEYIKHELQDFARNYEMASEKARPHKLEHGAENILDMMLGFGMSPPDHDNTVFEGFINPPEWESEHEEI